MKQVHQLGGDVTGLVPPLVRRALLKKLPNGAERPRRLLGDRSDERAERVRDAGRHRARAAAVASRNRWRVSPSAATLPSGRSTSYVKAQPRLFISEQRVRTVTTSP